MLSFNLQVQRGHSSCKELPLGCEYVNMDRPILQGLNNHLKGE